MPSQFRWGYSQMFLFTPPPRAGQTYCIYFPMTACITHSSNREVEVKGSVSSLHAVVDYNSFIWKYTRTQAIIYGCWLRKCKRLACSEEIQLLSSFSKNLAFLIIHWTTLGILWKRCIMFQWMPKMCRHSRLNANSSRGILGMSKTSEIHKWNT